MHGKTTTMETDLGRPQSISSVAEPSPIRDARWVAEHLGISKQQVYSLASSGIIPAFKPTDGCVRFIESEILAYREQSRIQPRPTLKSATPQNTVLPNADDGGRFRVGAMRRG